MYPVDAAGELATKNLRSLFPFAFGCCSTKAVRQVTAEEGSPWPRGISCVRYRRFNTTFDWHPRPDLQRIRYPRAKDEGSKSVERSLERGGGGGRPGQHVPAIYIRALALAFPTLSSSPSRPLYRHSTPRPFFLPTFSPRLVSFRRRNHRRVTGTKTSYNLLERHDTPCRGRGDLYPGEIEFDADRT